MRFLRKLFRNRQGDFVSTRSAKISCTMGKKSVSFCCSKRAFLLYLINDARPPNMLSCRGKQVFLPPFSPSPRCVLPPPAYWDGNEGNGSVVYPFLPPHDGMQIADEKAVGEEKRKGGKRSNNGGKILFALFSVRSHCFGTGSRSR